MPDLIGAGERDESRQCMARRDDGQAASSSSRDKSAHAREELMLMNHYADEEEYGYVRRQIRRETAQMAVKTPTVTEQDGNNSMPLFISQRDDTSARQADNGDLRRQSRRSHYDSDPLGVVDSYIAPLHDGATIRIQQSSARTATARVPDCVKTKEATAAENKYDSSLIEGAQMSANGDGGRSWTAQHQQVLETPGGGESSSDPVFSRSPHGNTPRLPSFGGDINADGATSPEGYRLYFSTRCEVFSSTFRASCSLPATHTNNCGSTGADTMIHRESLPTVPDATAATTVHSGRREPSGKLYTMGENHFYNLDSVCLAPLSDLASAVSGSSTIAFYSYRTFTLTTYLHHVSIVLTFLTLLVDLFAVGSLCTAGVERADCPSENIIALGLVLPGILFDLANIFWMRAYLHGIHESAERGRSLPPRIFFARMVEFWMGVFQAAFAVVSAATFYQFSGSSCTQSRIAISSILLASTYALAVVFDLCALACRYTFRFVSNGTSSDPEREWFQYLDYVLMRCATPVLACLVLAIAGGAAATCESSTAAYHMAGLLGAALAADVCVVCSANEFDDWATRLFRQGKPSIPVAACASVFCITIWTAAIGMNLFTCMNALFVAELIIVGLMTIGAVIAVFKAATFTGPTADGETSPLLTI
ncbi:unnamed protein product [Amoebophrya sp. A120]|nr:unnamed protein product [Amoebophrya sp. A120]|eukprot:GSA120T00025538001.1